MVVQSLKVYLNHGSSLYAWSPLPVWNEAVYQEVASGEIAGDKEGADIVVFNLGSSASFRIIEANSKRYVSNSQGDTWVLYHSNKGKSNEYALESNAYNAFQNLKSKPYTTWDKELRTIVHFCVWSGSVSVKSWMPLIHQQVWKVYENGTSLPVFHTLHSNITIDYFGHCSRKCINPNQLHPQNHSLE